MSATSAAEEPFRGAVKLIEQVVAENPTTSVFLQGRQVTALSDQEMLIFMQTLLSQSIIKLSPEEIDKIRQ